MSTQQSLNNILTDANTLIYSSRQKKEVQEVTRDILLQLNDDIVSAHVQGKHRITASLPVLINIDNMNNSTAKLRVWSLVIRYLTEKNYKVSISYTDRSCTINVSWISDDEEKSLEAMKELLNRHTVN
jgi:hypothetical protein